MHVFIEAGAGASATINQWYLKQVEAQEKV